MKDQFWKLNKPTEEAGAVGEKHAPVITIIGDVTPGNVVQVKVDVGEDKHPNENAHHIQWVELRANDLFIGRAEFTPVITKPVATFTVIVPEAPLTLTAIERCNLHGLWESEPVVLG